jgi:hypothetical protein
MKRSAKRMISNSCRLLTARNMSPINAAELSSYPDRTCHICCTLVSIASCLSLSCSGVSSVSSPGLVALDADDAVDERPCVELVDVMSSRETADETAELAGVLKFLDASLTFQN